MSEILSTNPLAIRHLILYEVLLKRTVEEGYQNLCEALGDNQYDYVDYQFWFYRFYHGNMDLEYDRSADPYLTPTDLPSDVLCKIVGELDIKDRMSTRKVCHLFQSVVDCERVEYNRLAIREKSDGCIEIEVNDYIIHYQQIGNDCTIQAKKEEESHERLQICQKVIDNSSHVDMFLNDLAIWLKPSIIHIDCVCICPIPEAISLQVLDILRNILRLRVRSGRILLNNADLVLSTLSCFEPGTLDSVWITHHKDKRLKDNRTVETEQFKQATSVDCRLFGIIDPIHIHRFHHLEYFEATFSTISAEDIVQFRNALIGRETFRQGRLVPLKAMKVEATERALKTDPNIRVRDDKYYSIPDFHFYLEVNVCKFQVTFFGYSTQDVGPRGYRFMRIFSQ